MKFWGTVLYVDDVPAVMDFYRRVFGLETRFYDEALQFAESLDAGVTWKYIGEADIELPAGFGGANATHWAPDVVRDDMGLFHMFLTAVPGIFGDWNHPRQIVHLTSKDLRRWRDARPVTLATDRAIDASVIRLPAGGWRIDPGEFVLHVGRSSADLPHAIAVRVA